MAGVRDDVYINSLIPAIFKQSMAKDFFKLYNQNIFLNIVPFNDIDSANGYDIDTLVYDTETMINVFKSLTSNNVNPLPNATNDYWELKLNLNIADYISDQDILNAFNLAKTTCSSKILEEDNTAKQRLFFLLVAHYVEKSYRMQFSQTRMISSESRSGISVSYEIPTWAKQRAFAPFNDTPFGMQYAEYLYQNRIQYFIAI